MIKSFLRLIVPHNLWQKMSKVKSSVKITFRIFIARIFHVINILRIRSKVRKGEKIKVLFIVNDISKWKCQSLYEALEKDSHFEPMLGITFVGDFLGDKELLTKKIKEAHEYFSRLCNRWIDIYDVENDKCLEFERLGFDIVFYPQSWYNEREHSNLVTHRFALPCYVPYYVPNYGDLDLDVRMMFHRYLAFYFTLNAGWTKIYRRANPWYFWSGWFVTSGHPMLDKISHVDEKFVKKTIIYAPHWTFSHPKNAVCLHYSTFLGNGLEILEYAQKHTEFNWIFKPHPLLKDKLILSGVWQKAEVDAYYEAWNKLGGRCEDGDYAKLFATSDAMITDCGSFLTEYAVTEKPIIHLICKDNTLVPIAPSKKLYDTYYQVHNLTEMYAVFDRVLIGGDDYKKIERIKAVRDANLIGVNAADNIICFLYKIFGIRS